MLKPTTMLSLASLQSNLPPARYLASAAARVNVMTAPAAALFPNTIRDNAGARKQKVRIGRGRGSGCGKTSGRGQKGQRARNSVRLGFEGGQTPLQKRLPKINTFDYFAKHFDRVPLGRIQRFVDTGRLDPDRVITMRDLVTSGCVRRVKEGVVLGVGGVVASRLHVEVTEVEPEAARAIVKAGGKVTLAWYNRLGLRALIKPEKWSDIGLSLPRWARPPPKMEQRYPDRRDDNLPVRVIESEDDVEQIEGAWTRTLHERAKKRVSV